MQGKSQGVVAEVNFLTFSVLLTIDDNYSPLDSLIMWPHWNNAEGMRILFTFMHEHLEVPENVVHIELFFSRISFS